MSYGYTGKILKVDLTQRRIEVEARDDAFYRRYLGGRGLALYYLLTEMPADVDPLGPDNLLVLAPGVITGAPVSGQGRNGIGAKSPLTGGLGSSEAGGFWGAELKRAGFDAVVVRIADKAEYTPRNVQTQEERSTTVFAIKLEVADADGRLKPGMPADVEFE